MIELARSLLRPLALRPSTWRAAPDVAPALVEWTARTGYVVRGLLYLAMGAITLLAVALRNVEASSPTGAMGWLAQQPFSWVWLVVLAAGLIAFCLWRLLQGVFDIDRAGLSLDALSMRTSQAFGALGYAALAWAALSLAFNRPADPDATEIMRTHRYAEELLSLPHGEWILAGLALAVAGVGIGNMTRAWREDFTARLSCSEQVCVWLSPLARIGYFARGFAYIPLAGFILLAAVRSRPSDVTTLGGALDSLASTPAGKITLCVAALGFIAFGAFSLIEARFRRMRLPR